MKRKTYEEVRKMAEQFIGPVPVSKHEREVTIAAWVDGYRTAMREIGDYLEMINEAAGRRVKT